MSEVFEGTEEPEVNEAQENNLQGSISDDVLGEDGPQGPDAPSDAGPAAEAQPPTVTIDGAQVLLSDVTPEQQTEAFEAFHNKKEWSAAYTKRDQEAAQTRQDMDARLDRVDQVLERLGGDNPQQSQQPQPLNIDKTQFGDDPDIQNLGVANARMMHGMLGDLRGELSSMLAPVLEEHQRSTNERAEKQQRVAQAAWMGEFTADCKRHGVDTWTAFQRAMEGDNFNAPRDAFLHELAQSDKQPAAPNSGAPPKPAPNIKPPGGRVTTPKRGVRRQPGNEGEGMDNALLEAIESGTAVLDIGDGR